MDAAAASEVVSKGRFAEMRRVSPGRVSQWISEGKIKSNALVGEGRNAKIDVAVATLQLRSSLDINQAAGNGVSTNLDLAPPVHVPEAAQPAASASFAPASAQAVDLVAEAIKQQRLDQLRRANRQKAEEEAARSGKYVETTDAVRQLGTVASQLMSVVEGSLTEIATAIAAKFEIPQRDVLHLMRGEFRKVRANGAKMFRDKAIELPATIETSLDDDAGA